MKLRYALVFLALVFAAPAATAQSGHAGHGMGASAPAQSARSAMAEGEVRKIDRVKGTVILKHGPLAALGMGPMTMEFVVTDAKLLANVKEGDKVRFEPAQGKDGTLTVSKLEVVK